MNPKAVQFMEEHFPTLAKALVFFWRMPLVRCPFCKGAGGEVSGYYEPEWSECMWCWSQADWLADNVSPWFEGRVHPLRWPRLKILAASNGFYTA